MVGIEVGLVELRLCQSFAISALFATFYSNVALGLTEACCVI